jgi:hypothetical protein
MSPDQTRASYRWATVVLLDPLRVRLDGETDAMRATPETLVRPDRLAVGCRVWVQFHQRRVTILGVNRGGVMPPLTPPSPLPGRPDGFARAAFANGTDPLGGIAEGDHVRAEWSDGMAVVRFGIVRGDGPDNTAAVFYSAEMPRPPRTLTWAAGTYRVDLVPALPPYVELHVSANAAGYPLGGQFLYPYDVAEVPE